MASRIKKLTLDDYVQGVLACDRAIMGRAITLVESRSAVHQKLAGELLGALTPHTGKSLRIGVTGVPGVGKSTFIEAFGMYLMSIGKKVAVLAVDPSSTITGGSILGDKTRMERLSREPRCFIRPTPSSGALGGVAGSTMETILICEAAGFDVVFVETVGVGQSEVTVRQLVDFFVLLMLPNAGDSLQGIKRGIMELADCIVVNKADGNSVIAANSAKIELEQALTFMRPATKGWNIKVLTCSAVEESGVEAVYDTALEFVDCAGVNNNGSIFELRRREQSALWFRKRVEERIKTLFFEKESVKDLYAVMEDSFLKGDLSFDAALTDILKAGKLL